jgi:fucose 4-O-acetylase-like acetyltransferase
MIFSFHMPLFFILSGYTTKLATDWKTLLKRLKKNFLYLILPTLFVLLVFIISDTLSKGDISGLFGNIGFWLNEFFIMPYPYGFYNASAVWFLVALFFAKLIMDFVNVTVKTDKNYLIYGFLGIIGICLGVFGLRPPFYLDLAMVGTAFIAVGQLWRKYEDKINKYGLIITIVALMYWFARSIRGDYLEMWTRFYAGYEVSILVAIAGTWIVCEISKVIEEASKARKKAKSWLLRQIVNLGQHTILLFIIHSLDTVFFYDIWNQYRGTNSSVWLSVFLRLALNLSVYVIVYNSICLVKLCRGKK